MKRLDAAVGLSSACNVTFRSASGRPVDDVGIPVDMSISVYLTCCWYTALSWKRVVDLWSFFVKLLTLRRARERLQFRGD